MTSAGEAKVAVSYGASAIGVVSQMPSGPAVISDHQARAIVATTPPCVSTFLLTSKLGADEIVAQQQFVRANTLQLVDRVSPSVHAELKARLPGIALVQVIHVVDELAIEEAAASSQHVDALLLDSGVRGPGVAQFGGTGRTHNWSVSRRIVTEISKPVFLAGGLRPENVRQAIEAVNPFGVDVCSGVRTDGVLDPRKVEEFVSQIHR